MARNIVLDEEWVRVEQDIYYRVEEQERLDGFAGTIDAIYRNPERYYKKSTIRIVLQELANKGLVFACPEDSDLWMTKSLNDKVYQCLKKKNNIANSVHGVHIKDVYNEYFVRKVSYQLIYQTAIELCAEGRAYTTFSEDYFVTNDD